MCVSMPVERFSTRACLRVRDNQSPSKVCLIMINARTTIQQPKPGKCDSNTCNSLLSDSLTLVASSALIGIACLNIGQCNLL